MKIVTVTLPDGNEITGVVTKQIQTDDDSFQLISTDEVEIRIETKSDYDDRISRNC
jgi:hypothetical protein